VAVADSGERLDTKKERVDERTGLEIGDAISADAVERGEDEVDADVNGRDERDKSRPTQREEPLISIPPVPSLGVDLEELNLTGAD
jgi:hypothetical protein